ncbi:MAG: nickel-dependent lactate racemase [Atribacterota bacterium]|nr:nickel-dependent lactate racemase [Atribacterota bacterium]
MEITIPYGEGQLSAKVPDITTILKPIQVKPLDNPNKVLLEKLENPIGISPLSTITENKKDAVIVINDITRPCHSEVLIPNILKVLNKSGIEDQKISLLVATGNHRENTMEELEGMLGNEVVNRIKIYNHNTLDKENLVYIGETKRKIPIYINKLFVNSSLKILTGIISPHRSMGFGGGRKSVLPGISGFDTIRPHHSFPIIPLGPSLGWVNGNPMHEEALEAARMANVDFIVNVVNNIDGEIADIFVGDLEKAFNKGVKLCNKVHQVIVSEKADIVITSPGGFPRDFDLHQSQKALVPAEMCCKEGGIIILVTESRDGVGKFGSWLRNAKNPEEVVSRFKKEGFTIESSSKAFRYARALMNFKLMVVTKGISSEELKKMFFLPAEDVQCAVDESIKIIGPHAKFIFIPYSSDIIPTVKT